MTKFQLLLLGLALITCCKKTDVKSHAANEKINFFDEELLLISNKPILNIYCAFEECGEWGGHEEYIVVTKRNKTSFKINYEKYSVNCDSMVTVFISGGYIIQPKKTLIKTREIVVGDAEKQAILDFSLDMVKSKFKEEFPGHSGIILSITNSDSTFFIRTYGGDAEQYLKMIDKLHLGK